MDRDKTQTISYSEFLAATLTRQFYTSEERIRAAFRTCGIEMWELYGHSPTEQGESFMWTDAHASWEADNPPPLEPIGDQSVQAWRASENAKQAQAA